MGREIYRSDGFIFYHCDGCGEQQIVHVEDTVEGATAIQKEDWSVWRPMAPDDHLKLMVIDGKKVISCDPICNEYGDAVERHYCPTCIGPKTDYDY